VSSAIIAIPACHGERDSAGDKDALSGWPGKRARAVSRQDGPGHASLRATGIGWRSHVLSSTEKLSSEICTSFRVSPVSETSLLAWRRSSSRAWPAELAYTEDWTRVPWLRTVSDSGCRSAAGSRVPTLEGRDEYRRYAPAGLCLHEDSAPSYGDYGRALSRGAPCEQ
jgi:hypothetical protein